MIVMYTELRLIHQEETIQAQQIGKLSTMKK
jgi:hypothetical protein